MMIIERLQTASQIAQGMVACGITTQVLKHITGRETPSRATQDGGIWRFFPNQKDYHEKVPKYDAFPSGHLATAMMTLDSNCKELRRIYLDTTGGLWINDSFKFPDDK